MYSNESDQASGGENVSASSSQQDSNRYNISNLLKHIYSLKYSQKPSQASLSASSSSMSASSSVLPAMATSNDQSTASLRTSNAESPSATSTSGHHKQFWMPDDQVKECFECNEKFTTFRRRHVY